MRINSKYFNGKDGFCLNGGWPLAALVLAATVALAPAAMADSYYFSFSGGGLSGSGILQYSNTPVPNVPGAYQINGISGTFTDTAKGVINQQIMGVETTSLPSVNGDGTFLPPGAAAGLTFDNLFYPGGNSPLICPPDTPGDPPNYPFAGGVLDIYGVVFDVSGGYTVDLWSDGITNLSTPNVDYEVDDALNGVLQHPDDNGNAVQVDLSTSPTPEPGSLFLLGTGLLGSFGALKRKSRSSKGLSA